MGRRPRVVIVGAGFGGLNAAKAMAGADVEVTIVDANNYHLFQPLLYQVAIAGLDDDDIAYPTRGLLRRIPNASFRLGRVTAVDTEQRRVALADGTTLPYDHLVVAAGAVTNTFGVPGVAANAIGMKTLPDATEVRQHILRRYEEVAARSGGSTGPGGRGAAEADPGVVDQLSIAIVGGGPTGVELAGGLEELRGRVLRRDFPDLPVGAARVTLIEATDRVLGTFAPKLSANARRALERRGVTVQLGTAVSRIDPGAVVLADGHRIQAGTIIWAAGIKAAPLASASGLPLGRAGRVEVDEFLRVPARPEIWVVGDIAASLDGDGGVLPQVAQVAIQGGRHVGRSISALVSARPLEPFRYRDKGAMATIGRRAAVSEFPNGLTLRGSIGWLAWLGLHLVYLIGFRNRVNVLVNWAWNYLTYDHGSRLLESEATDQVVEAV